MIYQARINKKIRNVKVYLLLKKLGEKESFMTKLFIRIFNPDKKKSEASSAAERLG